MKHKNRCQICTFYFSGNKWLTTDCGLKGSGGEGGGFSMEILLYNPDNFLGVPACQLANHPPHSNQDFLRWNQALQDQIGPADMWLFFMNLLIHFKNAVRLPWSQ